MVKIEVFSGPNCNYCARAKTLLDAEGLAYEDLDISIGEDNMKELVRRLPRSRSIPQIFINGEHIGGCEDLESLRTNKRLEEITRNKN